MVEYDTVRILAYGDGLRATREWKCVCYNIVTYDVLHILFPIKIFV